MSEIRKWLEVIGLGQYADPFETNEIGMDLLGQVDDQMLKDIGVSIGGHRLRIRNAIAKLSRAPAAEVNLSPTPTPETPSASAERRQVTVMFCDLVGSTALSGRLDPEDLGEIIGTYHRCCTEQIVKSGGFVARYLGDGVLAYFGYPRAHEHDAERAVRTGLALVEVVPKLETTVGFPLQVRVGIATGLVVVGELIGEGAAQEQTVVGETPNLAARLQALAEPGAVVIASSTRALIGGLFEYRDLGAVALKGFAKNVPAWQVLGAGATDSRFEALHATTTPLIGRDEEIDLLLRRWEQAKGGDGQVVLISGEPGIGKSRIAEATLERLSDEPYVRLRYFCSPHHQDSALHPSIAQLERAAGLRRDDTNDQRLDKLEAVLTRATKDVGEAVPLLADLLSVSTGDRYPSLNLTPQKRKEKTLRAQLTQVEGLAAQQPVVMVWEDLHWSDPTTRESLDLLVDRVSTLPVLVIMTFRPEFAPPWVGRPNVTMLILNRLSARQRAEMITHVTGGKALPKEMVAQIIDRTDGVPLFIEELTKAVVESGVVVDAGDRYTATGPAAPLAVPTSLHASLLARLDRLAPTREVAQIGAALGRSFSHELISAVAQMPQRQVDVALAQLASAELIFRHGTPPDAEYTFKHALVQDAAYSTLLRGRRQHLHAHIAATLEDQFPEIVVAQPALLARHCAEAGLAEKAVGYWLKAGQQAMARSATTEAVLRLQKGLDVLADLPDGPRRRQQELDLQIALASALAATKGYSATDVGETIARAHALAEQIDRPEHLVPLIYGQFAFHMIRSEHKRALLLAEQIERIGETRNDVVTQLQGRRAQGATRYFLGEFVAARDLLEQCHGLRDAAPRATDPRLSADPYVLMLAQLALVLSHLGYVDQARRRFDEALSEARRLKHALTLTNVLVRGNLATSYAFDRSSPRSDSITRTAETQRHAEELLALSTEHGFPLFLGWATALRGWSLATLGQAREGLTLLTRGLTAVRATGAVASTPLLFIWLAEACAMLGQPVEGLNHLAEAAQIIETTDERCVEAELHRLRGHLLSATGDRSAAEQSYHQALAVAKRQSTKTWELLTAMNLARLWRDQGKRTEARHLLAPVYGWFTEGFDTPVLRDAKALLDELA
jgi:class 3 adenylate cyclase/tetratricopeptide (TPR) repeat protein